MINQRLAFCIQPNPIPPMNDDQIDVVANTIMNAINYAAAFDLNSNAVYPEPIQVHKKGKLHILFPKI